MTRLPPIPEGYTLVRGRRGLLARADDRARALTEAGFGPDGDTRPIAVSDLSGRHPLGEIRDGERRLLVRRYAHGGLLRWLTGDRFARAARPFEELCLAEALRARGLSTPRVVAARAVRVARGPGWHLALVTERIEDAVDLATIFERARQGRLAGAERHDLTRELGRLLLRSHELGFEHVDLQLRNLLAQGAPTGTERLWFVDLDRSRLGPPLAIATRVRNLSRLVRSARRRDRRGARVLADTDLARLLVAYGGREAWRGWRDRIERHLARRARRHRLGWWLERRAGADPARRDGSARIEG